MSDESTMKSQAIELTTFLVTSLLPDNTSFTIKTNERRGALQLIINTDDAHRGALIGRGGSIARAVRQVVSTARLGDDYERIEVDIAEGEGRRGRS